MKKNITLLAVTAFVCISFSAFAKKINANEKSLPGHALVAGGKTKNKQNSQKSNTGTTSDSKNAHLKKKDPPLVENKIAVSDGGVPANKSNAKTSNSMHPSDTKKASNAPQVSPK